MDPEKKIAPYGTWESPISLEIISASNSSFTELQANPKTKAIYLVESRPSEGGRCGLIEFRDGASRDVLPAPYSIGTRVHEYGGGAITLSPDDSLIFNDAPTGSVRRFRVSNGSFEVSKVVEGNPVIRFADFSVHPKNSNWILAVREDHTNPLPKDVVNTAVFIDASSPTSTITVICEGADFYTHPKFSGDGKWISWVQWQHPDMPWTGSELYVAEWLEGKPGKPTLVAGRATGSSGKEEGESVGQPKWHSYGGLMFTCDKSGWTQLFMYDPISCETRKIEVPGWEEVDLAHKPLLGECSYIEVNPSTLAVIYTKNASNGIILVGIASHQVIHLPLGMPMITTVRRVSDTQFTIIGTETTRPTALYLVDIGKPKIDLLQSSSTSTFESSIFSQSQHISFPRSEDTTDQRTAHAILTPPHNPLYTAPPDTLPPLILFVHGGPVNQSYPSLSPQTQYWTSRGFFHAALNHLGSTGYGRAFRQALNTRWGIADISDAVDLVSFLTEAKLIDGTKVGITGGSAGGYSVLNALATYPDVFAGGVSYFGIGDLKSLGAGTHKYESHFLYGLLFRLGASENEQERIMKERSPIYRAENIKSPLLLLQGDADDVVPMGQAVEMERVARGAGADVKLVIFEGEGHGFKRADSKLKGYTEEESWWRKTLL